MKILGFDHPPHLYYLLERDMWAQPLEDGRVRIGITAFGVHISGHFFMCRPKPVGTDIDRGATLAVAELNKAVVTIKSPVSGRVLQINPLLADRPELIESDPYGQAWLVVMQASRWELDRGVLAHGPELRAQAERRMRLENLDFSQDQA